MKPQSSLRALLPGCSTLLVGLAFSTTPASASNIYWDSGSSDIVDNGDGASAGGAGIWDTTIKNWDAGASPHVAWVNANHDTAVFGGIADTVALGTDITVGGLIFDTESYTIVGDTLTFGAAGPITTNANATIASIVAGSATITKDGTGTLTLSGPNIYDGGILVGDGTLQFNSAAAIGGSGRSVTVTTGATVTVGYAIDNAFLNRLAENSNAFNINMAAASMLDLDLSSSTGANLPNATLNGLSSSTAYSGILTPGGNTYRLGNVNTRAGFSNSSVFTVSSALSGSDNSVVISGTSPVYLKGTLTYGGTTTVGLGAALGFDTSDINGIGGGPGVRDITVGAGSFIMRRGGNLDNALLQRMIFTHDTFTIIANNASCDNDLDLTGFPNASLATWDSVGSRFFAFTGTITPGSNGYLFGSSRVGNYINLTAANMLTGANALTVVPGSISKLRLWFNNDFSGDTLINAGTLYINHPLVLQNSTIDTSGAGVIDISRDTGGYLTPPNNLIPPSNVPPTTPTFGGLKGSKNITGTDGLITTGYGSVTSLTLNPGPGVSNTYSGVISEGAPGMTLTKTGLGTQILEGANTYTGATTISDGTLLVNNPGSLDALSAVVVNDGTLGGSGTIGGSVTVAAAGNLAPGASAGTLSIGGDLDISAPANGGTGKLKFELATPTASDKVAVAGTLAIGTGVLGLSDFVFTNLGGLQAGTYPLITTTGGIIGTLDPNDRSGIIGSLFVSLQIDGNNLELFCDGDSDSDGLPDSYELAHTIPPSATALNPNDDLENGGAGDGLTNLEEYQLGTDPLDDDSDDDGIKDGAEVHYAGSFFKLVQGSFTYPQAVADAAAKHGRVASFPNAADYSRMASKARQTTQGYLWIGLSDAATEGTWLWTAGTPATYSQWLTGEPSGGTSENHVVIMENSTQWADTMETFGAAGYIFELVGLDPLDPDTDGDGLTDGQELNTTHSSPVLDDTDGDGLTDGAEVNIHGSSPLLVDTDADGLNDRVEVEIYHTNPSLKDSDSDGFDDLFEINTGFDPTLDTSTPDALSSIRTAVEFRFNAATGVSYRIEASTDLNQWDTIETGIIGQSAVVTRFYSIENQPRRYFRARRN